MPLPQKRLIPGILIALMVAALAAQPLWWTQEPTPVIVAGAIHNGKAPTNIGQAKHMVSEALKALEAKAPTIANQIRADLATDYPNLLIIDQDDPDWSSKQRAPLLIGQLKAIAHPFYERLNAANSAWVLEQIQLNHDNSAVEGTHYWNVGNNPDFQDGCYPWNPATPKAQNKSIATIGQLKVVFSLRFEDMQGWDGPSISIPASLQANSGNLFTHTISFTGDLVTFSSSTLPYGLSLDATTGVIQGTPGQPGSYPLQITATNAQGSASAVTVLTVVPGQPTITSPLVVTASAGKFFYYEITASHNPSSLSVIGDLPPGLEFDTDNSTLSGILTDESQASFTISANVLDGNGTEVSSNTQTVTFIFGEIPQITSEKFATATQGAPFSFQVTALSNPLAFEAAALPAGLSMSDTGLISGTPTAVGNTLVTIRASNHVGASDDFLQIDVKPQGAPVLTLPEKIYLTVGVPFTHQINSEGLPSQYSATDLPAGLSLNSANGLISGTPTTIGTPEVRFTAVNPTASAQKSVVFVVMSPNKMANGIMKFQNGVSPSPRYQAYSVGVAKDSHTATIEDSTFSGIQVGAASATRTGRVLLGFPLWDLPADAAVSTASLQAEGFSQASGAPPVYPEVELRALGVSVDWEHITWNSAPVPDSLPLIATQALSVSNPSTLVFPSNATMVAQTAAAASPGSKELRLMLRSPLSAEELPTTSRPRGFNCVDVRDVVASARPELTIGYTTGAPPEFNLPTEWVVVKGSPQSLSIGVANVATPDPNAEPPTPPYISAAETVPGLSFSSGSGLNAANGTLSATTDTTVVGNYSIAFSATNPNGTGIRNLAIRVIDVPAFTPPSLLTWEFSSATQVSYTITASNHPTIFTASNLPDGLVLNQSTGVISGITQFYGTRDVTVTAANEAGYAVATLVLTVSQNVPDITSPAMANGRVNSPFTYQIVATQGANSYSVLNLPSGLGLSGSEIGGTPTQQGSSTVTVRATNSEGTDEIQLMIDIQPALPQLITTEMEGQVGQSFESLIEISNPSSLLSINWNNVPTGLEAEGTRIEGIPTIAGDYTVDVTLANQYGTVTSQFDLKILPALSLTSSLSVNAKVGEPMSHLIEPGSPTSELQVVGLPQNGLSYNSATRTVSGTPLDSGMMSIPVTISSVHGSQTEILMINVAPPNGSPEILEPYIVDGEVGQPFTHQVNASNSPSSYEISGNLPTGVTFSNVTGSFGGTPTQVGEFPVQVTATTNLVGSGSARIKLRVSQANALVDGIVIVDGSDQVAFIDTTLTKPLEVKVLKNGNPVGNALVVFEVQPGNGRILAADGVSFAESRAVVTNAQGKASVVFKLPGSPGKVQICATVRSQDVGNQASVSFTETAILQSIDGLDDFVQLRLLSVGNEASPLPKTIVVQALNPLGSPIPGKSLTISRLLGNGTHTPNSGVTNAQGGVTFTVSAGSLAGGGSSYVVKEANSGASLGIVVNGSTVVPAPGGSRLSKPDVDGDRLEVDGFGVTTHPDGDDTDALLSWSGVGANSYIIEWKTGTGNWRPLATPGGLDSEFTHRDVKAGRRYHYRIFAVRSSGEISNPQEATLYLSELLDSVESRYSDSYNRKDKFPQFTKAVEPEKPKWYLTETVIYTASKTKSDSQSSSRSSENYISMTTYKPERVELPSGGIRWDKIEYGGNYSFIESARYPNAFDQLVTSNTNANATRDKITGQWSGSRHDHKQVLGSVLLDRHEKITSNPRTFLFSNKVLVGPTRKSETIPGDQDNESVDKSTELSNEYTTEMLITDGQSSLSSPSEFRPDPYFFAHSVSPNALGSNKAHHYLDSNAPDGEHKNYSINLYNYKLKFYPSFNENYKWLEVFAPSEFDHKYTSGDTQELARLGRLLEVTKREVSASSGQAEFTIDPRKKGFGRYFLLPIDDIEVEGLDNDEKKKGLKIISGQSVSFSLPSSPLPGSRYSLRWTASSSFSVFVVVAGVYTKLEPDSYSEEQWSRMSAFTIVANENAPLGRDSKLSFEITHNGTVIVDDSFKVKIPDDRDFSVTVDEASGAQYRKIALNGTPLPDSKPQQESESDSEPEQTFIDALTLGLRHSTTDVYLPVPGSDLSLSCRRDFTSEVWSERSGQRPQEDPQKPFGACWSSNLTPSIKLVSSWESKPSKPDTAYVVDESGATHAFFVIYGDFRSNGYKGKARFFPVPSSRNQQAPNLASLVIDNSGSLVFSRKFGTTIRFEYAGIYQSLQSDRLAGDWESDQAIEYLRATSVTDRLGTVLLYDYSDYGNLIPSEISVQGRPDLKIYIRQNENGLVTSVWDSKGNETKFDYVSRTYSNRANVGQLQLLDKVTNPDGSTTKYQYEVESEADQTPVPALQRPNQTPHWHCELKSITDPLQQKHTFAYEFDHSRMNYKNDVDGDYPGAVGYYTQTGLPRNIKSVTFPNNSVSNFQNKSKVWVGLDAQNKVVASGQRQSVVTDTLNFPRTYSFEQTTVVPIPEVKISYPENRSFSEPLLVVYQKMSVQHGNLGSESFEFNLDAAMALKWVTDFCGNTTTFNHADAWNTATAVNFRKFLDPASTAYRYHSDPTSQTNALNQTKYFTYTPDSRLMRSVTDENGQFTEYTFDALGRRTREIIYSSVSRAQKLKDTGFSYADSRFPGFMTSRTVYAVAGSTDPAWVSDLVTEYVPDANGRIAQEIVDPRGLRLVTKSTYDKNGNKLTTTDPRGNTTWFTYDSRNRITHVTHADGTFSHTTYDARGNKVIVADEKDQRTGLEYDALGRAVKQVQDLNGNLAYNATTKSLTGVDTTDITSSFSHNNLGSKLTSTDPRGIVTVMRYDSLQRLTKTIQPKANRTAGHIPSEASDDVTSFGYETSRNCGGTAFDSSGFKPTFTVDPRGYRTEVNYDDLYRPYFTSTQYQLSPVLYATSSTEYDNVGNAKAQVDPLGKRTEMVYDGLYRPTITRFAVTNRDQVNPAYGYTQAYHTSTGFTWKQRDQEGRETTSQYDAAGRVRYTTSPQVDRGDGTLASAVTETIYDAAGNPAAIINPLGKRTDAVYDVRNRKIIEQLPAVFDQLSGQSKRPTTRTEYDATGKVIKTTDAKGQVAHTLYDRANRPTHTISPAAPTTLADGSVTSLCTVSRSSYDANGNILTTTRGGIAQPSTMLTAADPYNVALTETLVTATNTYDALNRLATTKDAANITVTNEYDASGNLTAVTDGKNQRTQFTYDGLKRNTSTIDPALRGTTLFYDAVNKTARVDSKNQRTEYLYDDVHRLKSVSYIDRTADNRSYTYDKVGNLCAVTESKADKTNIAYAYDALNRQIRENQGAAHAATLVPQAGALPTSVTGGLTHSYKYDLAGNRLQTIYGGGRTITSTYDALNRLKTLVEASRTTTYSYDLNGGIAKLTHPNNTTIEKSFDSFGRATSITTRTAGTTLLSTYSHGFDLAGNCRKIVEDYASGGLPDRTVTNTYDLINRLTHETVGSVTTQYLYDNGHNRTAKLVTGQPAARTVYTNSLNQADYHYIDTNNNSLWDSGETKTTYVHDFDGNRTSATKLVGTTSTTDTYGYDYDNRLVSITKATPGADLQTGTYAYIYDYRTRRVERNEPGSVGVSPASSTKLVFSGGTSVQEYTNTATTPTVEFIRGSDYGGGIGGILYSLRGGNPSFTHYNNRGDVVAKTTSTGTLEFQASYEAYGKRTASQGSTLDRQKANTKDEDPTGLLNEGFRYRDLESGTFITRDPMGFVDGPNMYAYVRQNPWTKFDPLGLASADEKKWQGIAADENRNFAVRIGSSLMAAAEALNPFRSDSSLRDGGRQLQTGLAEGREKMKQAPPGIREVGLFAMGVGSAGTFMLSGPAGVGEMGDSIQKQGVVETGKQMATGLVNHAMNNPVEFLGEMTVAWAGAKGTGEMLSTARSTVESQITNPVPGRMARVVPEGIPLKTLGAPGEAEVFVTAASDISGMSAQQIATRLTIPQSPTGFQVVEFPTPGTGVASPIRRSNQGFVGRGRTAGDAREFSIPNQEIPAGSKIRKVK